MKILMIAPTPFFADRGCHVRIYEELRILQQLGCEVILSTYHNGRDVDGVRIERIINIPWYKKLEAGPSWQKPFLDLLLLIKSFVVAKKFKPDLIHSHLHEGAFIGIFLSRYFKLPLVFDYQGSLTGEMEDHRFIKKDSIIFKAFKLLEGWIENMSDVIITSSTSAAETINSYLRSPEKATPLPDGVDTEIFNPSYSVDDIRNMFRIPKESKVVVYLGLLNEYQGLDLLLESAVEVIQQNTNIHFLLMGYPNVEKYKLLAKDLGINGNITFTGRVDYSEAPKYLCLGDIAISAKLSKTEANGKIFNYMASGLPTVCFDTPVNREILGDLGVYVEFGNKVELANAILTLLSDQVQLNILKNAVRERAEKEHSWKYAGQKLVSLYADILQ